MSNCPRLNNFDSLFHILNHIQLYKKNKTLSTCRIAVANKNTTVGFISLKKKWIMNVYNCNCLIYSSKIWPLFIFRWLQIGSYFYLDCWSAFQNWMNNISFFLSKMYLSIFMCEALLVFFDAIPPIFAFSEFWNTYVSTCCN